MDNTSITPQVISPFKHFCVTIGELPTSYLESMTYYEMLQWFCNFLAKTVIPAVNNNASALAEVQELYTEVKNYVDNYFENLDISSEINNKLDEMAQDGSLDSIIDKYTQPQFAAQNQIISNQNKIIANQNQNIAQLSQKINSINAGNPQFVESTSQMTDNNKIYVLRTNAHIYYYNPTENEFIDSGLTYSDNIDGSMQFVRDLTSSDNINNLSDTGWFFITDNFPQNLPINAGGILFNIYQSNTRWYQLFIVYDTNKIYYRNYQITKWSNWLTINQPLNFIPTISDANTVTETSWSVVSASCNNIPFPINGLLLTFIDSASKEYRSYQIYMSYDKNILCLRNKMDDIWKEWQFINPFNKKVIINNNKMTININGIDIDFSQYIDETLNVNICRLGQINYGSNIINPTGSDVEGPIYEKGATDFVGGIHGNEIQNSMTILIDGKPVTLSTNYNNTFNKIDIYINSTIYSQNKTPLCTKNMNIEITNNIKINNSYKFLKDCIITQVMSSGVMSAYTNTLNAYTSNVNCNYNTNINDNIDINNQKRNRFKFITKYKKNIEIKTNNNINNPNYMSKLLFYDQAAGKRLKVYFYYIYSTPGISFNENDEIYTDFEISIT